MLNYFIIDMQIRKTVSSPFACQLYTSEPRFTGFGCLPLLGSPIQIFGRDLMKNYKSTTTTTTGALICVRSHGHPTVGVLMLLLSWSVLHFCRWSEVCSSLLPHIPNQTAVAFPSLLDRHSLLFLLSTLCWMLELCGAHLRDEAFLK